MCYVEAHALIDCAYSASFISEKLATGLSLQPTKQNAVRHCWVHPNINPQQITSFVISPISSNYKKFNVTEIIVPRVTSDLPLVPIPYDQSWRHLSALPLAKPQCRQPGRIDILLGIDIMHKSCIMAGRRDICLQQSFLHCEDSPCHTLVSCGWHGQSGRLCL